MIQNILLAADGSAPAERAADFAASLSARYQARVTMLHVFAQIPSHLGEPNFSEAVRTALDGSRSIVEDAAKRLRELGAAEVDTDVIGGAPAEEILTVSEARQPDLIVMGARGLSTLQGLLLGSVSTTVVQRAACPVLIVK